MNIRIFINSQINSIFPDDIYSSLTDNVSEVFPDTFVKVPTYLTWMKQIYNNHSYDYIGICPGNYHFTKFDFPVSQSYLQDLFHIYDVILPFSSTIKGDHIEQLYNSITDNSSDLLILENIISELFPSYTNSYHRVISRRLLSTNCMLITSHPIFQELTDWLYEIFNVYTKKTGTLPKETNLCIEVLFRTFFTNHNWKIKEESIRKNDIALYDNIIQKTELILKYIQLRSEPVIAHCRESNFGNLDLPDVDCQDDFEGKIPIWFCWWQGLEEMPLVTKVCTESLKRHFPTDKVCFRFITLENCQNYVSFTDAVITKFNEGKITLTELSDILRSELLYRYGGLWIDATIFVTKDIPDDFWEQDFFSLAFNYSIFGYDIPRSRWTPSLWYMKPGNILARFLLEAFWHYWEIEDELIHYFLLDYLIAIAYDEFPEIKSMIDECTISPATIYDLQLQVNQHYSAAKWNSIVNSSIFYKLNRRNTYCEMTLFQCPTIFHHMCSLSDVTNNNHLSLNCENPIIITIAPDSSTNEILTTIQTYNPSHVLDCGMYFSSIGAISLMSLNDTIFGKFVVDAIPTNPETVLPIDYTFYNQIHDYSSVYDDIRKYYPEYDLILLSGNYI